MRRAASPIRGLVRSALLCLAGCLGTHSALSTPRTTASIAGVSCTVKAEPTSQFLRLQALARADRDLQGQYSLLVSKRSETGSSQNAQSGDFALSAGSETILSTLTLDRSALGHYEAKLVLTWDQGSTSCQSP